MPDEPGVYKPKPEDIPTPPIEVPCRDALPAEIPPAAKQMSNLALKHGWEVRTTYARGPWLNVNGSFNRVVDSIAVRMRRGSEKLAGTWINGTGKQADKMPFSSGHSLRSSFLLTSTELKEQISRDETTP